MVVFTLLQYHFHAHFQIQQQDAQLRCQRAGCPGPRLSPPPSIHYSQTYREEAP